MTRPRADTGSPTVEQRPRLRGARAAFVVCHGVTLALSASALARVDGAGLGSVVLALSTLALAATALAALALARRLRGGTALVDVVHPLVWLVPWQLVDLHPLALVAIGLSSAAWIGATCGFGALRAWTAARLRAIEGRHVGLVLLCVVVWLSKNLFPEAITSSDADTAWGKGLAWILRERAKAGVDYAFTHGPLGYMATIVYDQPLFWVRVLVVEGLFRLAVSAFLVLAATRIRGTLDRALYLVLLVLLPVPLDSWMLLACSAITFVLVADAGRSRGQLVLGLALLAAISLTKLTFAMLALASVLALAVAIRGERPRRDALRVVALYVALSLGLWLAIGQSLATIPSYVRWSLAISGGYNEAESTLPGDPAIVTAAYVVASAFALLVLLQATSRPSRWTLFASSAAAAFGFFVAFKVGFVRANDHTPFFFAWAVFAGYLVLLPAPVARWRAALATTARATSAIAAVAGWAIATGQGRDAAAEFAAHSVRNVRSSAERWLDLRGLERELEQRERVEFAPYDLPRTRAVIGDTPIDMVSWRQGLVFMNGFRWNPRPVFQSFVTFTPGLLELNARFYESERAPEYVLFHLGTIDYRLPTIDDGLVLQILARDYEPVLLENANMLLRREKQRAPRAERELVLERTIAFGEPVDLGALAGQCHVLELSIETTLAGRLETALVRAPPLSMKVEDPSGLATSLRIVPGMMRTGAIVDPMLLDHDQWVDWITSGRGARLARLTVEVPAQPSMYEPRIGLKLWRDDSLAQGPRAELRRVLDPVLYEPAPDRVEAAHAPYVVNVHGLEGFLVHAPARLEFDLPAGSHRVTALYGLHPQASDVGDGAVFTVEIERAGERTETLARRTLQPHLHLEDRGPKRFEFEFASQVPCTLVLATSAGESGSSTGDWTWWTRIRVE